MGSKPGQRAVVVLVVVPVQKVADAATGMLGAAESTSVVLGEGEDATPLGGQLRLPEDVYSFDEARGIGGSLPGVGEYVAYCYDCKEERCEALGLEMSEEDGELFDDDPPSDDDCW